MAKDLLDLHGYKVDEVPAAIDRFLMQLAGGSLKRARIMTGKGTGAVKAKAIQYLKQAGYPWSYDRGANGKQNEGCLLIHLD